MQCERSDCAIIDCWKECPYERHLATCPPVPIIAGETGAGGLAKTLPPAIAQNGSALVYGHGVFTTGREDFAEAFRAMVDIENWCREEYFLRLDARMGA
jgi:ribulose-5-phosphate 4-epimerase/fuculose-1-phosphate aldolase